MKNIKPLKLGLLHKPYEAYGKCYFAVTVMAFFPFSQPGRLLPEIAMWKFLAEQMGKDVMLDMGMPKPHPEVLVYGACHAPGGVPTGQARVAFRVGELRKELAVFGDRHWVNRLGMRVMSEPQPFTRIPLDWSRAYGGPAYPDNPLGKGHEAVPGADGLPVHHLPNVEYFKHLMVAPGDQPEPASFGALDFAWPQRQKKAGSYDDAWLKTRFPGYADDMDWTIFNAAAPDQWLKQPLRGQESFEIEGMHPSKAVVGCTLPGHRARCLVNQQWAQGTRLLEIPLEPETLFLFPQAERGILLHRGVMEIATDDASDILQILIGAESMQAPRSREHYEEIYRLRMDPEQGPMQALRDEQLCPADDPAWPPLEESVDPMAALVTPAGVLLDNQRRRAERELQQAQAKVQALQDDIRQKAEAMGLPVPKMDAADAMMAQKIPPKTAAPTLEDLPKQLEQMKAQAKQAATEAKDKQAEMMQRLQQACDAAGLDLQALLDKARAQNAGRPKFSARAQMDKIRAVKEQTDKLGVKNAHLEEMLADPKLAEKLQQAEQAMQQAYQKFAHAFPAPLVMSPEASAQVRASISASRAAKTSLAHADFSGADLSGLDLSGADLQGAILDSVVLTGANLAGARLNDAVLARAHLVGAKLQGCDLSNACLGEARLDDADLTDAVLQGAILMNASLLRTNLSRCKLAGADFTGARFGDTLMVDVDAPEARFLGVVERAADQDPFDAVLGDAPLPEIDLRGVRFTGATLHKAIFVAPLLDGADFSGANLSEAAMLTARGAGVSFRGATLDNFRVVKDSVLPQANFAAARMVRANLRGTDLAQANFEGATLTAADLSECQLPDSNFKRVNGVQLRLVKANLLGADLSGAQLAESILQKARLQGALLRRTNLFMSDLLRIQTDDRTDFSGANLGKTLRKDAKT